MPRFAANLSTLFDEFPFLERFRAASDAGFRGVEYQFPYHHGPDVIAARARACGLESVLLDMPPGDWAAGERGITSLPGREQEFRAGVEKAFVYANRLGVKRVAALAGIPAADADRAACIATLVNNLKYAARQFLPHGITVLLEAINTRDMPGFLISHQADCFDVCTAVNAPNMKMLIDCYHMQIMEGDLSTNLRRYGPHCGHIQIAGVPGRNEPDTGEVRYEHLFRLFDEIGYDGWVGCEYRPRTTTVDGLGWYRAAAAAA